MLVSIVALLLAGLTAASPIAPATPRSHSKGFRLVLRHPDSPFDGMYVNSLHVGAGIDLLNAGPKDQSRIFYQNGTVDEYAAGESTIISDGGRPYAPYGFRLVADGGDDLSTAYIEGGSGTRGVSMDGGSAGARPGRYLVCDEPVAYYGNAHFTIVKNLADGGAVPKECLVVALRAECATLNALPEGSFSSHEYALETRCHDAAGKELI